MVDVITYVGFITREVETNFFISIKIATTDFNPLVNLAPTGV